MSQALLTSCAPIWHTKSSDSQWADLALAKILQSVVVGLHLVEGCEEGELEGNQYRELMQEELLGRDTHHICDLL